ncbi:MAG: putative DNA-binding domain-containing protein [Beijerinckiaceae bacterium]
MRLAELQASFQDAVLTGDRTILASIEASRRLDGAARFEVYADAYRFRLAEFLSKDYPVLRNALGDEDFGALVEAYIEAKPSPHRNARWYGQRLPEFMRETDPWRRRKGSIDLALFERALADAFDAADADLLDLDAVALVPAEEWPSLHFEFHPSVVVLALAHGTVANYAAASDEEALPFPANLEKDLDFAEHIVPDEEAILVWRKENQSFYRVLGEDETLALNEALIGKNFGDICSLLAFRNAGEDVTALAATFLAAWFRDGLVSSLAS